MTSDYEQGYEVGKRDGQYTLDYLRGELNKATRTILRLYAEKADQQTCFTCENST